MIHMDFEKCCRRKDAKAWRIKINGIQNCIVCPEIGKYLLSCQE